jgi:hypothetical protein
MKKHIPFKPIHLILIVGILLLIYLSIKSVYIRNEVRSDGNPIIAKFTLKDVLPKTTTFYFTYYFKGQKVTTGNSGIKYSILNSEKETTAITNLKLNAFYLANFDANYPNVIIVNPLKQITDTTAILKAGFSKDELETYLKKRVK